MSKQLTAQKNFLFNGRVLGVGERFSTSVLHARDLIVGKLAVEAVEDGKPKAKADSAVTVHDNTTVAGGASVLRPVVDAAQTVGASNGASSDGISGQSTVDDAGDTESNVSGDTQDASAETASSDDSTDENYDQMTMAQLKDVLNEIGVQFAARASKADLLELVKESFGEDLDVAANQNSSSN